MKAVSAAEGSGRGARHRRRRADQAGAAQAEGRRALRRRHHPRLVPLGEQDRRLDLAGARPQAFEKRAHPLPSATSEGKHQGHLTGQYLN